MVRGAPNYPSGTSARGACKRQGGGAGPRDIWVEEARQGFLTLITNLTIIMMRLDATATVHLQHIALVIWQIYSLS